MGGIVPYVAVHIDHHRIELKGFDEVFGDKASDLDMFGCFGVGDAEGHRYMVFALESCFDVFDVSDATEVGHFISLFILDGFPDFCFHIVLLLKFRVDY